ncbi:UDPglucose--hexose-1-phosphate uridylyltransferase [Thalassobacillus cyri]|uniref:Galactose-1-phosphate uridylyltransferase n=1 Tax=Thalassobacillus cyri TaxID=571932 RepID=A0A1H3XGS5_9BACI|nr:UDP-glucose--hexose-1-phosphate uridylyltransferase [Thalassobacillus cyri]SDZ97874.1 UDPglucose--hexose-1-phosphate uridylyltransferase [Thalassobacillus cyri]
MTTIYHYIENLIQYGLKKRFITVWDIDYARNSLYHLFQLDGTIPPQVKDKIPETPVSILDPMLAYAIEKGLIEQDTVTERDLFDAKIMDCLMPRPSEVIKNFYHRFEKQGAKAATEFFYQMSKDSHYIRTDRISKNMQWFSPTEYGDLEITINLSKPEKDPKAIAAAKRATKDEKYPKCLLCKENVGYAGRLDHPARDNHRIIPVDLAGENWFLQYSPYIYYNEHAIVFSHEHTPMSISKDGFNRLLHFVEQIPHYFVGSNADLPIVGGSILSHDHFQGGYHEFPMAKAPVEEWFTFKGFQDIEAGIVQWPMSVLRLRGENRKRLTELGDVILQKWRFYSDESVDVLAETNGEPHNTITPIARNRNGKFELDLVLRNNRTSHEHPFGIFHPHEEVHHIKKENIGLIEVMGLAVLPGRLIYEMEELASYMVKNELDGAALKSDATAKHAVWAKQIRKGRQVETQEQANALLKEEIGKRFSTVLEHAGVFKRTEAGRKGFQRFIEEVGR